MIYDFDYELEINKIDKIKKYNIKIYLYNFNHTKVYKNIILWYKLKVDDFYKNNKIIFSYGIQNCDITNVLKYNLQDFITYEDDNILLPFYFKEFDTEVFFVNYVKRTKLYIQQLDCDIEKDNHTYYIVTNNFTDTIYSDYIKIVINLHNFTKLFYYYIDDSDTIYKFEIDNINLEHFYIYDTIPYILVSIPIYIIKIE